MVSLSGPQVPLLLCKQFEKTVIILNDVLQMGRVRGRVRVTAVINNTNK